MPALAPVRRSNAGGLRARSGVTDNWPAIQKLDEWIRAHPNGTQIEVRLDPADSQNAELLLLAFVPVLAGLYAQTFKSANLASATTHARLRIGHGNMYGAIEVQ